MISSIDSYLRADINVEILVSWQTEYKLPNNFVVALVEWSFYNLS